MPRLAWLLTASPECWHATLGHLAQQYPELKVFVVDWIGYAHGYADAFSVEVVGRRTLFSLQSESSGYSPTFTLLPLGLVPKLWQWSPDVVFTNSFGMWTLLVLLLRPVGKWNVVIAYEGSAPGVDYVNSTRRLQLRRWMVGVADACITNSQRGKNYLVKTLKVPPKKVFTHPYQIPDKITLMAPSNRSITIPYRHPRFLYVGQLIPRKGLFHLIEACQILHRSYGESFSLLLIGKGSYKANLVNMCQQKHLTKIVHWLGPVPYRNLGSYYSEIDVLVFPTNEDTWGMVVMEAMLFAKPVICSQGAGTVEHVIDNKTGYCFIPKDSSQLAQHMARFIKTPSLAAELGHQAQAHMQQYTPARSAQFLSQVVQRVISHR